MLVIDIVSQCFFVIVTHFHPCLTFIFKQRNYSHKLLHTGRLKLEKTDSDKSTEYLTILITTVKKFYGTGPWTLTSLSTFMFFSIEI
jgi:hypothetical protein